MKKKITNKDLSDWENFLNSKDRIYVKDNFLSRNNTKTMKTLDLHGYSLRDANIGVQLHYLPIHLHPYYKKLGFKEGDFPESEFYAKNAISLPLYCGLGSNKQERVVNTLRKLLKDS